MYLENSGILRIKQDSNYGNALAQAGGRVTFGDANYVYVGESATEDDVLELKGAQGIVINAPGDMPSPFGQGAPWKISHVNLTTPISLHALVFQPTALSNVRVFLNSTGGLSASSDRALKTDVETLAPTLDRVAKLRPVSYRYKTDDGQPGPSALGFIAQEVEEQFPALVIGEEGSKILNYSELVPITIAALQEEHGQRRDADTAQAREIQALQRENAALQQRLEALEQRLGVK